MAAMLQPGAIVNQMLRGMPAYERWPAPLPPENESMERDLLHHFLRSGPARKFDVSSVTRRILRSQRGQNDLLFRSSYCNTSILFKCVSFDDSGRSNENKPIDMLVYLPYDDKNPGDGGESFLFTETNYWQYFQAKLRRADVDLPTLQADYAQLMIFESVPSFSPFILELAFERAGYSIPKRYLDLPPELRSKLREHIAKRIRPLTVAAFRHSADDAEHLIEDLTNKLFSLRNKEEIMPLIQALRIPEDEGIQLLSAWIGITYFEYEYAIIQQEIKKFASWLIEFNMPREALRRNEKANIEELVAELRCRMRADWSSMLDIWKRYVDSYEAYVSHDDVDTFSTFLRGCTSCYWRLAEILGKLEQTLLTWRHFTRNYYRVPLPYLRLMEFYAVLRRLYISNDEVDALSSATFDSSLFSGIHGRRA